MIVAIIGLGQIGASLAAALKKRRLARVVGISRRPATVREALQRRLIDEAGDVDTADVVVLATPVRTLISQLKPAARRMKRGAILTDVGSTKEAIVHAAKGLRFVPGHPMAGSEKAGIAGCDPDLFVGRPWVLLPGPGRDVIARLVRGVGAKPVFLASAAEHDRIVAECSHLPHLMAYALMGLGADLRYTGGSFRDATRVALSDVEMVLDFLLTNRHLRPVARRLARELMRLASSDARSLRLALRRARDRRSSL